MLNDFGQLGFGGGERLSALFSTLTKSKGDSFSFGSGDIYFVEPVSAVRWSPVTFIKSNADYELLISAFGNTLSLHEIGYTLATTAFSVTTQLGVSMDVGKDYSVVANGILSLSGKDSFSINGEKTVSVTSGLEMVLSSGSSTTINATGGIIVEFWFICHHHRQYRLHIFSNQSTHLSNNTHFAYSANNFFKCECLEFTATNLSFAAVNNIQFNAGGTITLDATKSILVQSDANVDIKSALDYNLFVGRDATLDITGKMGLKSNSLVVDVVGDADFNCNSLI